ncbi:AfsR/SARP family transcriptional regulator [Actinomadura formosensis]|uniref:AfsR/SARP family transcriptional regulator n=1 Tax=Actinomadura formosensis TaxID=60706 RepID=UPI00082FBF3C|nr:AfsR/SARP family transcriptional regulator [Actinomadura formosensis]
MKFTMLGTLEVVHDGRTCTPTAPKVRQVLALLLSRPGQIVELESIIKDLWDERPPRSAVTTTQTYIYQLRRTFAQELGEEPAERLIGTVAPGYVLRVDEDALDSQVFARQVAQGRALHAAGESPRAAQLVRRALGLWRGPVLSNVDSGPVLRGYTVHLEERRIGALELLVQLDMELGRGREIIPDLRGLVAAHPFNEWFHVRLITALGRAGRRGEALRAYENLRRLLSDELGLDPSPEARQAHRDVLTGNISAAPAAAGASLAGRPPKAS